MDGKVSCSLVKCVSDQKEMAFYSSFVFVKNILQRRDNKIENIDVADEPCNGTCNSTGK